MTTEDTDLPPAQGGAPEMEMDPQTGEIMLGWPEGKPPNLVLTVEHFESLYYWHNLMMRLIRLQEAVIANIRVGIRPPRQMLHEIEDIKKKLGVPE
jgi:hypothetical protein